MSFKREGDKSDWLSNLRKRRIDELLSDDIPDDEAHLMKNGKYACLVCCHKPVFDTLDMMGVHRNGKKHKSYDETFQARKHELEELKLKRAHGQYLKDGKIDPDLLKSMDSTKVDSLIKAKPYDPRVKKSKPKRNDRRKIVDLESTSNTETTEETTIPGSFRPYLKRSIEEVQNEDLARGGTGDTKSMCGPVKKERHQYSHSTSLGKNVRDTPCSSAPEGCAQTISQYRQLQKVRTVNQAGAKPYLGAQTKSSKIQMNVSKPKVRSPTQTCTITSRESGQSYKQTIFNKDKITGHGPINQRSASTSSIVKDGDDEKKKLAERYLALRGSGWKKDWLGNWVKDEDVEFDSDEEPPNIP